MLGVDLASMDGDRGANWSVARAAGVRFAYIRRSYSYRAAGRWVTLEDASFAQEAAHARAAGIIVGCYFFPALGKNAPDAKTQVAALKAAHGDVLPGVDLPIALDVEFSGRGIVDSGASQAEVLTQVANLILEIRSVFGCWPMVYSSHVQMHDNNGLGINSKSDAHSVDLLSSCPYWPKTPYRLRAGLPLDSVVPPSPRYVADQLRDPGDYWRIASPWQNKGWIMQQFQGDARGFGGLHQVDVSLFNVLARSTTDVTTLMWYKSKIFPKHLSMVWDDEWDAALRAFQASNGIAVDGVIGPATFVKVAWS